MSEMVERLARRAYEEDTGRSDWDEETEWMDRRQREHWRDVVRGVLKAMREPTEAMAAIWADEKREWWGNERGMICHAYTQMIDAALSEEKQPA